MQPDERDAAAIRDMLDHCRGARDTWDDATLELLVKDRRLCLVIERYLEIVGEAAGKVSAAFRAAHPEIPWQELKDFRNVLAHEYGNIEHDVIRSAVRTEVPALIAALEAILASGGFAESKSVYRVRRKRISVDLDGRLLTRARVIAFARHESLSKFAEEGLRLRLAQPRSKHKARRPSL